MMKIKVVLERSTLNLMWACTSPERFRGTSVPVGPDHAIIELDADVVERVIDLCEEETFDEAVRRVIHTFAEGGDA